MAIFCLEDDLLEESYTLIGLRTNLVSYKLVYQINAATHLLFCRQKKGIDLGGQQKVPLYAFEDQKHQCYWQLFPNQYMRNQNIPTNDLFGKEFHWVRSYMIPEHKQLDYFIKVDAEAIILLQESTEIIKNLPGIVTAYKIETNDLKSINHLMF